MEGSRERPQNIYYVMLKNKAVSAAISRKTPSRRAEYSVDVKKKYIETNTSFWQKTGGVKLHDSPPVSTLVTM